MSIFFRNLKDHQDVISRLSAQEQNVLDSISIISEALSAGGKLMTCGNGGSAADSQHIASEFTGRFVKDRIPLAAMALSTDSSALTCIANDYSFSEVFSRQVLALGKRGDALLAISTSGNSSNVINAVIAAKEMGIHTIGLLGNDGGKLAQLCDCRIIVPSSVTARIQEVHILLGHTICGGVEIRLGFVEEC